MLQEQDTRYVFNQPFGLGSMHGVSDIVIWASPLLKPLLEHEALLVLA